jgi:dipeptidyl aminopeptidase/acylaminoacyl peptidase
LFDHSVHDVVALDAGTGARTRLGTLPGEGVYGYVFQRDADRSHVLILTSNGDMGVVSNLQAPTDASLSFGFISKRDIDYGSGLVLSPRGDLVAGVDDFDHPTGVVISGVERGSRAIPLPSGVRRLLVLGWSPDQSALVAIGCRPCNTTETPQERQTPDHEHVYIVPLDGSPWRELLDDDNGYFLASWSPDGSTLAVTDFECVPKANMPRCPPGGKSTTSLVAVVDAHARVLVSGTERMALVAWSPDSRRIAFVGGKVGEVLVDGGIYVMNADGSGVLKIADTTTGDGPPIWSPDGRWLMYRKDSTTEWWIVPAAGGEPRPIGNYGGVAW